MMPIVEHKPELFCTLWHIKPSLGSAQSDAGGGDFSAGVCAINADNW